MSRDDHNRTWQLVMTGHGLHHVGREAQAAMARLLDLDPSISHLTVDNLIERIAASGVSAIVVHGRNGAPPRRVSADD